MAIKHELFLNWSLSVATKNIATLSVNSAQSSAFRIATMLKTARASNMVTDTSAWKSGSHKFVPQPFNKKVHNNAPPPVN